MYYDIDLRRGEAELGIMLDQRYWNQGYGTDSIDSLLSHIFTTTPINRVYLHTLEWNGRARKSFGKSGFQEVKPVRRNGMNFILMEVLRSAWEQSHPSRVREASGGVESESEAAPKAG